MEVGVRTFGGFLPLAIAVAPVVMLASCAAPPPPPPPTIVMLTITGGADENPDGSGRPSPTQVTVFQLASAGGFEKADYFQLADKTKASGLLGQDLLGEDEAIVAPGEQKKITVAAKPDAKFLGVIGGYFNIDAATWRADTPIPPNKTTPVTATVGKMGLTLTPGP